MLEFLNNIPPYIVESIMNLLIVIIGGLIVGYFTSKYLYKINELNKIEGWLLQKKIPIYKEIFTQLEKMSEKTQVSEDVFDNLYPALKKNNLTVDSNKPYHKICDIFRDYNIMDSLLTKFETYTQNNRIYFDQDVAQEIILMHNYNRGLLRLVEVYDQEMTRSHIENNEKVKTIRKNLILTIGLFLSDEFCDMTNKTQEYLRNSINHLDFKHRKKPEYNYDYFIDEKGFVKSHLLKTQLLKKHREINQLIMDFIVKAYFEVGLELKDNKQP